MHDRCGDVVELTCVATPYDQDRVAGTLKLADYPLIALNVFGPFSLPEESICPWHDGTPAVVVCVPKAAVDENHPPAGSVNDIRCARQVTAVEAVAKPKTRKKAANC